MGVRLVEREASEQFGPQKYEDTDHDEVLLAARRPLPDRHLAGLLQCFAQQRERPVAALVGSHEVDLAHVQDRKSTRLNSSHSQISYAVFCLKKKNYQYHRRAPLL